MYDFICNFANDKIAWGKRNESQLAETIFVTHPI